MDDRERRALQDELLVLRVKDLRESENYQKKIFNMMESLVKDKVDNESPDEEKVKGK